ncbi:MAG: aminoacyl-tRNA hydrolase, partial [Chloroflexota bacterium]
MKVIVGLGNPGREYANTRHNLGFMVVDELGRRAGATSGKSRFKAELLETTVQGLRLIMVKPLTYMN